MILLDTHVVLWLTLAPDQLSKPAREAILQAQRTGEKIACSQISIYEIGYAAFRQRLQLTSSIEDLVAAIQSWVELVPLTTRIALCAAELPAPFHGDPMDRIIAATAITADCTLITRDDAILRSGLCRVLW